MKVIEPQGAMYMMVGVEVTRLSGIGDDVEFAKLLLAEENVEVLPGQCFGTHFMSLVCLSIIYAGCY